MNQEAQKRLVSHCPVCDSRLEIRRLGCTACETAIETRLAIPPIFRLPQDLQDFVLTFLRCQGKIRDVEKELGISYPTVVKRLELVNKLLGLQPIGTPALEEEPLPSPSPTAKKLNRTAILEQLERGEISVSEATQLLRQL